MATEMAQRIGARIRVRRLELGLNQRQLAERLPDAVTNQHISNWERAINKPSDRYLELLAGALEVEDSYFLATQPDAEQQQSDPVPQPEWARRLEEKVDAARVERVDHEAVIDAMLQRQTAILERIESLVLTLPSDEATERLLRTIRGEDEPPGQARRAS